MKHAVGMLMLMLAGCASTDGQGRSAAAAPPSETAPVPAVVVSPAAATDEAAATSPSPGQSADTLLAAERQAFSAVAPSLLETAAALIAEHRVQAEHLGGGPVIMTLPTVGAVVARSRHVDYGIPVIDRLDRDPESISHPFTARVLVSCTVSTRESREVQAPVDSEHWQPPTEPSGDLPLPSAAIDEPHIPESLRLAAAVAAAECQTATARSDLVVVALRFRFRLETGRWEVDRERR